MSHWPGQVAAPDLGPGSSKLHHVQFSPRAGRRNIYKIQDYPVLSNRSGRRSSRAAGAVARAKMPLHSCSLRKLNGEKAYTTSRRDPGGFVPGFSASC